MRVWTRGSRLFGIMFLERSSPVSRRCSAARYRLPHRFSPGDVFRHFRVSGGPSVPSLRPIRGSQAGIPLWPAIGAGSTYSLPDYRRSARVPKHATRKDLTRRWSESRDRGIAHLVLVGA